MPYWKHPVAQIYQKLRVDLERVKTNGRNHSVILVPARLLWLDAIRRFGVDAWYDDDHHGTPLARYFVGCILFTYLSGKDPRQNPVRELPLPRTVLLETPRYEAGRDDANWVKEQVCNGRPVYGRVAQPIWINTADGIIFVAATMRDTVDYEGVYIDDPWTRWKGKPGVATRSGSRFGFVDCPGIGPGPYTFNLHRRLGDRKLYDGAYFPPRERPGRSDG